MREWKIREWKIREWKNLEQVAGMENAGVENAGVDSRGIATDEMSRYCYIVLITSKTQKPPLGRPTCLAYVVSKNCIEENQFSTRSDICLSFD